MSDEFKPLLQIIDDLKPATVALVSRLQHNRFGSELQQACAEPAIEWSHWQAEELVHTADVARYDLVILYDMLTERKTEALPIIAHLRDVVAKHLVVRVTSAEHQHWQLTDFIALGMKKTAVVNSEQPTTYYSFDIYSYKTVPDWLNPKYWANPENWDKYRW